MSTRNPAVADQFYPKDPIELKEMIESLLKRAKKATVKNVRALIVPHAGYVYSGIVAAAGYSTLKGKKLDRAIILGPSHRVRINGGAFDTNEKWKTPLGFLETDSFPSAKIKESEQAHKWEHSIEVQLPFIQMTMGEPIIIPIALGSQLEPADLEKAIDKKTILIVSSDLSHYLPYEHAKETDNATIKKILGLNPSVNYEEACGADGINTLIKLALKNKWKPELIDYKNSGDTYGEKHGVVGYACIAFTD